MSRKMVVSKIAASFMLLLSIACNPHPFDSGIKSRVQQEIRTVPYTGSITEKNTRGERNLSNLASVIGVDGFDKISSKNYIRIWIWDLDSTHIINMVPDSIDPYLEIVTFKIKSEAGNDSVVIYNQSKDVSPNSGWGSLFATLQRYKILDLTNGTSGKNLGPGSTTMTFVHFEIFRDNKYGLYEFLEPSFYRYVNKPSRDIFEFLDYLDGELPLDVYKPDRGQYMEPRESEL